jgi:hypothetical protein
LAYVGPFSGETLNITRYSSIDGDYLPASPVKIVVNTTNVVLASSLYNTTYALGDWSYWGSCLPSATSVVWDSCFNTYVTATASVPAPVTANGYSYNPCGFAPATSLPPASNTSTFSVAYCPINSFKGAVGIKKLTTGQLFGAGASAPGPFTLSAVYLLDDAVGTVYYSGTFGTATVSTSVPIAISVTKYPALSAFAYPFWYEAANGTKFVPSAAVAGTYNDYIYDRSWLDWLNGDGTSTIGTSVINDTASNTVLKRWTEYCSATKWYCDAATGIPRGLKSPVITASDLVVMPTTYSTLGGQLHTSTSLGDYSTVVTFSGLFKRLPPAVALISYTASHSDNYVAVQGMNSGNAGQLTLIVNYTSGPSSNLVIGISSGAFSFRIDSKAVSSICSGTQCLIVAYPLEVEPTPLVPNNIQPGLLGATTYSEFVFRVVVITVVGFVLLVLMVMGAYKLKMRWWGARGAAKVRTY